MDIKIKQEFLSKPVSWLNPSKETAEWLVTHNIKTVEDCIDHQKEIPKEMFDPLKLTMMCRTLGIPEPKERK